ncbi:MAG: EcsC family protein [Cyanobacteria bacterium P01_A01_bin.114]
MASANSDRSASDIAQSKSVSRLKTLAGTILSTLQKTTHVVGQGTAQIGGTIAGTVSDAANTAGNALGSVTTPLSTGIATAAAQTGKTVAGTASAAGSHLSNLAGNTTDGVGQIAHWVNQNPLVTPVTKALNVDWIAQLLDKVDVEKAETEVRKLEAKHPEDSPSQIAHRLMVRKATLAAGSGLASSALPGFATALLVADLSLVLSLQTEMVYQIAAAYGLDLSDPARKGEVLAIFGLSVGGSKAVQGSVQYATRAGILGFLRNIPAAGAVIGSSTNAAMTYALGYAACRFYESKQDLLTSESALADSEVASEAYLKEAMAQEAIMDQILLHVVEAAYPDQSWQEVLPALQQLHLSPTSLETLEAQPAEALPPLDTLLDQINSDFAVPLMAQCEKIVALDDVVTSGEEAVLQEIRDAIGEG